MTNKQIIDGVDVSECKFLIEEDKTCMSDSYWCEEHNCYYKQLKRKEQECEEIKLQLKQVKHLYEVQDAQLIDELATENKKLKAENGKLKEKFKKFFDIDNQECWDIAFLNNEILDIINKAKE